MVKEKDNEDEQKGLAFALRISQSSSTSLQNMNLFQCKTLDQLCGKF